MQDRKLVAFFKGTAGQFNNLGAGLACSLMAAAADMRNHVSPLRALPCAACDGRGWLALANGHDDFDKEECGACNGTGRVISQ